LRFCKTRPGDEPSVSIWTGLLQRKDPTDRLAVGRHRLASHPDYRGEQSLNIIAHGGFTAIALLTAMESDPQFAQMMQGMGVNVERTATGLTPRTPPAGWTWHHAEDPGVMQLVPRVQHAPGSVFWDTLHPGDRGGYAIWGQ
jgi:A nuclease of the HNH/ENDO VII superfamily with conserved WHH